jgi:DNA-directed RNA polymerase specialized sigma24 family protein
MTTNTMTDSGGVADLARRAATGDVAAFAALYDRSVDHVWRTARGSGAGADEAERVVLAAYVELWRRTAEPEVQCRPVLWLMETVHRAVRGVPHAA